MVEEKLKLRVGLEIIIKMKASKEDTRIVGSVLGWEEETLIVTKIVEKTGIQYFSHNTPILVGCVNDGIVYGFNSMIIMNIVIKGLSLFVFEYPTKLEVFPLRKEERMGVYMSGSFKFEDPSGNADSYECEINDINVGGCAISTVKKLKNDDNILISFSIPTQGDVSDLKGVVANIRGKKDDKFGYGIKFEGDKKQEEVLDGFRNFVDKVKKLIRVENQHY